MDPACQPRTCRHARDCVRGRTGVAGTETALARVVAVFGLARPRHAYCFANRRANRMKVLVHDGIGVWLAARRPGAAALDAG